MSTMSFLPMTTLTEPTKSSTCSNIHSVENHVYNTNFRFREVEGIAMKLFMDMDHLKVKKGLLPLYKVSRIMMYSTLISAAFS
jgi:hypothetical protein